MKTYHLEFGEFIREKAAQEVFCNGESLGFISVEDVPYLTSRSTDEIFLSRIKDAIGKHFNLPKYYYYDAKFSHYIDRSGYLLKHSK